MSVASDMQRGQTVVEDSLKSRSLGQEVLCLGRKKTNRGSVIY